MTTYIKDLDKRRKIKKEYNINKIRLSIVLIIIIFSCIGFSSALINLIIPANNTINQQNPVTFNCNSSSTSTISNISLYLNGVYNQTSSPSGNINYGHGQTFVATGSFSGKTGFIVNNSVGEYLTTIVKSSSTTATKCYVNRENSSTILSNGTFTGDNCAVGVYFQPNVNYNVTVDNGGSDYTLGYNYTGQSYPYINGSLRFDKSIWHNGDFLDTYYISIKELVFRKATEINATFSSVNLPVGSSNLWNCKMCLTNSTCEFTTSNYTVNMSVIVVNSQTYNPVTTEGAIENFQINLTLGSLYRITTGNLIYNGTSYAGSISTNGNTYIIRSITIPNVTASDTKNFYWNINLDSGDEINTTTLTQQVQNLGIDDCSVYTNQLFNITLFDEDTQTQLNGGSQNTSIKLSFIVSSVSGITLLNYSHSFNYTNPAKICLQNSLNSSIFRLDGVVEYSSLARFQEYYNFQNYSLTNSTMNVNINLYDLNSSKGTEFKITYKDSNFVPVSGALLNIQRKYVDEGIYKTTEIPKTGTEGYTIAHLVRNDVIYTIIVMKDGVVLATFNDVVADCQNVLLSSCEINLNSLGSSSLPTDFTNYNDLSFTLGYNSTTRIINSIFTVVSGTSSTMLLNVTLSDTLGSTSVCSDSLFSSGGQLSCVVPNTFGNATVIATLYKDGKQVGRAIIKLKQDPKDIYGSSIILIAMLVFLVFAGFGATSDNPMFMAIMLIVGTIVLVAMNIIYSPSLIGVGATILWIIVAIVLILIKGSNRQ